MTLPLFKLTSAVGGSSLPYTFGHVFAKGEMPDGSLPQFGALATQCTALTRWDDDSLRFAQCTVEATLTEDVQASYQIAAGSQATGSTLTQASLAAALVGKEFTVQVGALGTVDLADLVSTAALLRTFATGPVMSEFHYSDDVDSLTRVMLIARVYRDGRVWVDWAVHNGYAAASANRVYTVTITVNGTPTVYSSVDQKHHTIISGEAWLGNDPQITPQHDGQYISDSKHASNYTFRSPLSATLTGHDVAYLPMGRASLRADFPGTGYDAQIGLLPEWDVLYLTTGDPRVYRAVIANARAGGSYSVHYRDATTLEPISVVDYTTLSDQDLANTGGVAWVHDLAHLPSIGYIAALCTANYRFIEEAQFWASYAPLSLNPAYRVYGEGRMTSGPVRAQAWSLRSIATAAVVSPDGSTLQTKLADNWRNQCEFFHEVNITGTGGWDQNHPNNLGVMGIYSGGGGGDPYTPGDYVWTAPPWMMDFMTAALGMCWDLEVPQQDSGDRTLLEDIRDFSYTHIVGRLGELGSGRPYQRAAVYYVPYGTTPTADERLSYLTFYASWLAQYEAEKVYMGTTDPVGPNLLGESGGSPDDIAEGYWAQALAAISYAVDHSASGAAAAYSRLTGAPNFDDGLESMSDSPNFAITPRDAADITGTFARTQAPNASSATGSVSSGSTTIVYTYLADSGDTIYGGCFAPGVTGTFARTQAPNTSAASGSVASGDLPTWAAGVPVNGWVEIAGSSMNGVDPTITPAGVTGMSSRIDAWNDYATYGSKGYSFAVGGHQNYSGNEVLSIDYALDSPVHVILRQPTPAASVQQYASHYLDGRPTSTHSYYASWAWDGKLYRMGNGSTWAGDGHITYTTHVYDLAANDWDGHDTYPNTSWADCLAADKAGQCQDPDNGDVYFPKSSEARLRRFNRAAGTFTDLAFFAGGPNPGDLWYEPLAFDHTRGQIMVIGPLAQVWTDNGGQGSWALITLTGAAAASLNGHNAFGASYDAASDRYLVKLNTSDDVVEIHPTTYVATARATTGGGTMPDAINGTFGRFKPITLPTGVIGYVCYPAYTGNVWFLRTE